ncbi:MAG: MIP/aquaporin family protein [Jiangellaceae bacterium]
MPDTWLRNAVAEAIGTFALCFVGLLVVASGADLTAVALANGVIILVFVAALGHVSGGHFNPAITLGMFLGRKIDIQGAAVYWAAQVIGALAASLVVLLATDRAAVAAGTPVIADGVSIFWAIVLEAVATFFLVLVVFGTVVDQRAPLSAYPFAIGLAITAGVFAIGPFTGGALNPARGFGPALVSGEWGGTAAWLIGPLVGGVLAWAVFEYVIMSRPPAVVDVAEHDVDADVAV